MPRAAVRRRPRHALKLWHRWFGLLAGLWLALLSTGLALVLPMHSLEPFLLTLSSIFVPLFGVILGRLGTGRPSFAPAQCKVDWVSASMWVGGIATYHAIALWMPQWGAALPTLALTFVLAAFFHPARFLSLAA